MKRKMLAALISGCMTVCAVSGCGNSTPAETTTAAPPASATEPPATSTETQTTTAAETTEKAPAEPVLPVMAERMSEAAITNTIPDDVKALAAKMPEANYQKLPDWNGTTLCNLMINGSGEASDCYSEELIKEVASQGFNFVRVPLDTRGFFTSPGKPTAADSTKVNVRLLADIDNLIKRCIENNIHVCLDVHNTFGGLMMGGDEEASREMLFTEGSQKEQLFFDFWEFMAARYADIPSNALSFDLYNEPPAFVTDEQYTKFIKKTLGYIHASSPDRLVFVDMLEYGRGPVYGLAGEKVVQSFHFYEPFAFTHSNYNDNSVSMEVDAIKWALHPEYVTYPLPAVNAGITNDDYVVTGGFPAGTELIMRFGEGSVDSGVKLLADGREIFSQKFDAELLGSKGYEINEDNIFACYEEINAGKPLIAFNITLTEDAKELRFVLTDSAKWLDLNELVIENGTYSTKLLGQWIEGVGDDLPPTRAQVDENGRVTLLNDADRYTYGRDDILKAMQAYKDFSDETGTLVMLQEFGDIVYTNINSAVVFYDDVMSVCDELGINWVHYSYDHEAFSYICTADAYKRQGAEYEDLGGGRYACVELRDVFRKHTGS